MTRIPLVLKSISVTSSPTHSDTRIPVPKSKVTMARSRSLVLFIIDLFLPGQIIAAMFDKIQKAGCLVGFQADDGFVVELGHVDKDDGVIFYQFVTIKIIKQTTDG